MSGEENRNSEKIDIYLNGDKIKDQFYKENLIEVNFENSPEEKFFITKRENPINDLLILTFEEKTKKKIIVISGENLVKKIRNYPKNNSLIQYNVQTQKIFKAEYLMSVGEKFPGESKAELQVFDFCKKTNKIEFLSKNEMILKKGDLMKIKSPFKKIDSESKSFIIGMILSDGSFNITTLEIEDFLSKNPKRVTPKLKTFSKQDEIFCSFDFINPTKFLIGSQIGTIYLGKMEKGEIKILNSFNRYNNFMVTNISVMPCLNNGENEEIFAYSTGDGFIKIQSTEDDFPLYEYQSISKTIRSLSWDSSTRALIFSDENEKFFISFYYFNPSNVKYILSKKITKTKYFVEVIFLF